MKITYGCDCTGGMCGCYPGNNHPVAYRVVERDGRIRNVCTRCILRRQKLIAHLFDANTDIQVFIDYDALGAFVMISEIEEKVGK